MRLLAQSTDAYKILSAERNGLRHAYLLHYADPTALRRMLREFAPLFFPNAPARLHALVKEEKHADCIFYPEEGKKFSVEDAERLAEEATLQPVEGEKKLFVIADISTATPQAQNKLLKLLEEPPQGVHFLLGATTLFSVLNTVLSRVTKLEIPPFPEQAVTAYLQRKYPLMSSPEGYASASGGVVGVAEELVDGGFYSELLYEAFALALADESKIPSLVKKTGETKHKKELLSVLRMIFKDALLIKLEKAGKLEKNFPLRQSLSLPAEYDRTENVSGKYSAAALLYAQEEFSVAEKDLRFNGVFAQRLELCFSAIAAKNVGSRG